MKLKDLDKLTARRLRRRVRVAVIDESRMKRLLNVRMAWWKFIVFACAGITLFGLVGVWLIVTTPLKSMLPGYLYTYEREDVMTATRKIDSIGNEVAIRNAYIANIRAILENDIDTTATPVTDSVPKTIPIDSVIMASEIERDYVREYESSQRFNVSVLTPLAAQGITFVNPMQGAEARTPEEGDDQRRITFDMPRLQPVSAVYRGTVMDIYNTMDAGFTVIIQHPNDFISRYSGLTDVMVQRGQAVLPASRIGLIERDTAEKHGLQPTFELWYNGAAVNPREYIPF